jgi:Cu/Ag efflux pump CusA
MGFTSSCAGDGGRVRLGGGGTRHHLILRHEGSSLFDAVMVAAKLRLRPILMTAFSFILGIFPLVVATGAGAEARKVMGMALLGGMTPATFPRVFLFPMLWLNWKNGAPREETRSCHPTGLKSP